MSSKPPPPKPPSTYSSDKPVGKERGKEKGKPEEVQTQKGLAEKERVPKGKMIPNAKNPKGIPEEERRWKKWKKRIATLYRVDILRRERERERRTGGQ